MRPTDDQQAKVRAVPIRWTNLDDSPLVFANNMLVQHTAHEFILIFGYVQPPIVMGEADAQKITEVQSRTLVRIALTPGRVQELLSILGENFEVFMARSSASADGDKGKE